MESIGRLLSLPLVKGTMQKLHMFSHPLMMELQRKGGREEKKGKKRGEASPRKKRIVVSTKAKFCIRKVTKDSHVS